MKQLLPICIFILLSLSSHAQANFEWARSMTGNYTVAKGIALDAGNNVYTTGYFSGVVDFDPGVGTYTLSAPGPIQQTSGDIFISKLDNAGNFIWAKRIGSATADEGNCITIDAAGNIYVTGLYSGTVDFDPGIGVHTLTATYYDTFILKLDASGNFLWVQSISFPQFANMNIRSIAIDATGNVLTAGNFVGTVDFDPGASVFNMSTGGGSDIFVSKLNASGAFVWAKCMGAAFADEATSVKTDASGNVYTTGNFRGTVDFDPGTAVFNLVATGATSSASDVFVSKLDPAGNFVWAQRIGGSSYTTASSLAVDAANVYVCGYFNGICDFDPGAGTFTIATMGAGIQQNGYTVKLDLSGTFVWAWNISGTCRPMHVLTDPSGNVYTIGSFGGADFNLPLGQYPGANMIFPVGSDDFFITKRDASGNFLWVSTFGGSATEGIISAAIANNNIYVAGAFIATIDFNPGPGVYNLSPASMDAFVAKYCQAPATPPSVSGTATLCQGAAAVYTASPVSGATSYSWYFPGSASVTVGSSTISFVAGSASGNVSVTANTGCGVYAVTSVSVLISPTLSVNSGSICPGGSFTIVPTGAGSYSFQGGSAIVSPSASATYSVRGTNASGCISLLAFSHITVLPAPIVSVNSGSVCAGNTFAIIPSGASVYTISGGSALVSPSLTTSYTVTGVSVANCISAPAIAVVTVQNLPLPQVIVLSSDSIICAGTAVTFSASGAATYTWNTGENSALVVQSPMSTSVYTVSGSGLNGCQNTFTIQQRVDECTGLSKLSKEEGMSLWPNPSTGQIILQLNALKETMHLAVYNLAGQLVFRSEINTALSPIDLGGLANGMYQVELSDDAGPRLRSKLIRN